MMKTDPLSKGLKETLLGHLSLLICISTAAQQQYYGRQQLQPLSVQITQNTHNQIYLPGNIVSEQNSSSNSLSYALSNHLASVQVLIAADGTLLCATGFKPFGMPDTTLAYSCAGFSFTGTYQWNGMTGLYATPGRLYDPRIGRFISRDPFRKRRYTL